jgi:pimeloyl-ACP methyl ester carboxylesterase
MPTLLVWGAGDAIVPPAYAEDFRALLPNARVELIEAAGHLPMLERPERLAEVVEGFLEG